MKNVTSSQVSPISEILNSEKTISPKIKKEKKEKVQTENVIAEKLISEKGNQIVRTSLYIYPSNIGKDIKKQKQFRSSLRGKLKRFVDVYVFNIKIKKSKDFDIKKHFDEFLSFYKGNYSMNDFSIGSLRESINEIEKEDLTYFLEGIKKEISK